MNHASLLITFLDKNCGYNVLFRKKTWTTTKSFLLNRDRDNRVVVLVYPNKTIDITDSCLIVDVISVNLLTIKVCSTRKFNRFYCRTT